MENCFTIGEIVCVSFKEIYNKNGAYLKYGGYIDYHTEYNDNEEGQGYYDLRNRLGIIACDGERFKIISQTSEHVILKNCISQNEIWLSVDEFNIGVFK